MADDIQPTAPQVKPEIQKPQSETKVATILIVEDDPVLLKMYSEKFTFEGFSVLNARDGEEALKVATTQKANIILLDIMLPKMSGTDFLEKFRNTPNGKTTPVLALTNLAEEAEKQKALGLGVKEYLVKAMQTPEQVVEKVKKYIA
ncbi:MAG: Phosphate regulon transcriptional regulatory protein PhoB [Candidatus Woesebacteria bacterium GW2011_GWA1_37_8]|uniref:Phosphate regulon transcriptional regulatory protein PhoB n=2 Tax=Candidatus Woeseibacteriota TaxID=1752722 RepID=A0A0G0NMZ1_9BACT|nr:MAG: Phosphate regulon transcriptional regulatory protein PhoB [Microgenomates group bacterium GW2011_GWC1_37_12b]KKQ45947.1 MAG: Phosphate regulon transcriptional regulatory protein PhoB [Candidatus Woesebacteria bacterium GW2011_GWA1_37_8]KKQ87259.1 MAG: Phosphate regulon transcriptional regulatory protein PhoB [Candidatus Woesebacteria bacterium GW2011_GWB1_38_8b]